MEKEQQFIELLNKGEDRQAVRLFRQIFSKYVQLEKFTPKQELIFAVGIINMIALSELGRNEKNYIPDVNAMINSIQLESDVMNTIYELQSAINVEYWKTAVSSLKKLEQWLDDPAFKYVEKKCIDFFENNYTKLSNAYSRQRVQQMDANKIIQQVKDLTDKQEKLI